MAKDPWAAFFVSLVGLAIVVYIFLDVDNNVRMKGSFNYLMSVFYGIPQANYYNSLIKYVPLLIGIVSVCHNMCRKYWINESS